MSEVFWHAKRHLMTVTWPQTEPIVHRTLRHLSHRLRKIKHCKSLFRKKTSVRGHVQSACIDSHGTWLLKELSLVKGAYNLHSTTTTSNHLVGIVWLGSGNPEQSLSGKVEVTRRTLHLTGIRQTLRVVQRSNSWLTQSLGQLRSMT